MKINDIITGLTVLGAYSDDVEMDYVPNSFPNMAPNHPSQNEIYFSVMVADDLSEKHADLLRRLGWHSECEGQYWCLRQYSANHQADHG